MSFWSLVADCLKPDGRVFFVDDSYRTADELIEGEQSVTIQRRLMDGTAYLWAAVLGSGKAGLTPGELCRPGNPTG
ncbi:hypothetical protein [Nonomuraea sp. B5E05]|uniref:hypothetical protein n=1 Tax=Nonomuraea sp. B5E05 TaxID=3153569 RepID=UPI00326041BE